MRYVLFLLLAAVLVACGGGEASLSPQDVIDNFEAAGWMYLAITNGIFRIFREIKLTTAETELVFEADQSLHGRTSTV